MKKNILKLMLATAVTEIVLVCIFVLFDVSGDITWKALKSVAIIFIFLLPCLYYAKTYDDERYRYIAFTGSICSAVSALLIVLDLWGITSSSKFLWCLKNSTELYTVIFILITSLVILSEDSKLLTNFKKISIIIIAIFSVFDLLVLWVEYIPRAIIDMLPILFLSRLYLVFIILGTGFYLCTLIIAKVLKKERKEEMNKYMVNNNYKGNYNQMNSMGREMINNISQDYFKIDNEKDSNNLNSNRF